jgi:hypothetical protein
VELLLLVPVLVLGGVLWYVLRSQATERNDYLRAIELAITEGTKERAEYRKLIAELTERIQHPEIPHPIAPVLGPPGPPPVPDEAFEKVGQVLPDPEIDESRNGQ